jgi:hypothetical protein
MGIIGAAVSALVGALVANPVNALFLKRRLDFGVREYALPGLALGALALAWVVIEGWQWSLGARLAVATLAILAMVLAFGWRSFAGWIDRRAAAGERHPRGAAAGRHRA